MSSTPKYEDFLDDRREERFCEYVASKVYDPTSAYQRAFRDDCGLERLETGVADKAYRELLGRSEVKGRIRQIEMATEGAGTLTKEGMLAVFEARFANLQNDLGGSSKDKLNLMKAMKESAEFIFKKRGWDKETGNDAINITMTSVLPAGFKGRLGGGARVSMDLTLRREETGVLSAATGDLGDREGVVSDVIPKVRGKRLNG